MENKEDYNNLDDQIFTRCIFDLKEENEKIWACLIFIFIGLFLLLLSIYIISN